MIKKKVCLLGTSGVGKTSLVSRFVSSIFSEKYLTTIGVKVDRKDVSVDGKDVSLAIWDIAGVDDFQPLRTSHLRGSGGCLLVADGTRTGTLDRALDIRRTFADATGNMPLVLALNKMDLRTQWEISDKRIGGLISDGWHVQLTSAKTGEGVEDAFAILVRLMMSRFMSDVTSDTDDD